MLRRIVVGDEAEEEIRDIKRGYATRSSQRASEFLSELRVALRAVQEFPFSRAVWRSTEEMEIRRAKITRFPYYLFYFVYPSVDLQTGEPLDVIYILACRHERQGEPPWTARDPFRQL